MPYPASALPLALLDLTLLRVGSSTPVRALTSVGTLVRWQRAPGWRRIHQAAAVNPVPPVELEEFLVGPPAKCVHSFFFLLDSHSSRFNRKPRVSERLSVRGGENWNTVPMHPLQELELRVNALDEAIETEVGSADLVGYRVLNKY